MRLIKFFHRFSYYLLSRWMRRKLKRWCSGFARIPQAATKIALVTVLVVGAFFWGGIQVAWGQGAVTIGNKRTVTGHNGGSPAHDSGSGYTGGVAGSTGTYDATGNWFGLSGTNNVFVHLNSLSANGGTVNISQLDVDSTSAHRYLGGADHTGVTDYYRGYQATGGPTNVGTPAAPGNHAYHSTFDGTVNVSQGKTTTLSASYGSGGISTASGGQLFTIDGTLTKAQAGRLSIQTNTIITTFATSMNSASGTLDISGAYGKIDTTAATFTAGTSGTANFGSYGNSAYYAGALSGLGIGTGGNGIANFSFTSGGNGGTANSNNTWTIADPVTSNGINNMGYMIVTGTGNNTLNGVTNIGTRFGVDGEINRVGQNGSMVFHGAVDFATAGSGNYLNINNGVLSIDGLFTTGTAANTAGTINHLWGQSFTTKSGAILGNDANSNITANVGGSTWNNMNGTTEQVLFVGLSGSSRLNILSAANGLYSMSGTGGVVNTGTTVVAANSGSFGEINVIGDNSRLNVNGTLVIARDGDSKGNMYVWEGGQVKVTDAGSDSMVIGNGSDAVGRVYIDGYGSGVLARSTLSVAGTLTVGRDGQAGGTYTDHRADGRYRDDPVNWFLDPYRKLDMSASDAKTGNASGNNPGLAITRGAQVTSLEGVIAQNADSGGYVVIDNANNLSGLGTAANNPFGTVYNWAKNDRPFYQLGTTEVDSVLSSYASEWIVNGTLEVGVDGDAFQRILNGGTLVTGSNKTTGDSTIIASGTGRGQLFVSGNSGAWGRSIFKSYGAAVVGQGTDRGTLRIYDGALGETAGLYVGAETDSKGEVFVDGAASTLRITKDNGSTYYHGKNLASADRMQGTGIFGASHEALVWLDADAVVRLNGNAGFSTGSVLHLDNMVKVDPHVATPTFPFGDIDVSHNPIFDAGEGRVNFTNARVEGIGLVTAKDGVHIRQSDYDTGQASIDPGLIYGWETKCEKDFFGDLYFGHSLNMTGHVITYFDLDAGFYNFATEKNEHRSQDNIFVVADPLAGTDQVTAALSGTLMIHARLTDYYNDDIEKYAVVTTIGDNNPNGGRITRMYDDVVVKPRRFFNGREQFIENVNGDDVLYVTMTVNKTPFEDSATTYNERSLGRVLDSIYALQDRRWLPFLRNFWYLEDPGFLEAYKLFGGEIRAHSLLMPLQNPWNYAHNRNGFNRYTGHVFFGPQNRNSNITSGNGLWGSYILTGGTTESDGNAGKYDLKRNGFAIGYEKAAKGGGSYTGLMFAYNQGKLDAWRSDAKSDDFQIGLYHGKNLWDQWEWKNYLGTGIQNFNMRRHLEMNLSQTTWNPDSATFICEAKPSAGTMHGNFAGLSFAGSTELSRLLYYGRYRQWTVRPYFGLDMTAAWQNRASERGDFGEDLYEVNGEYYHAADLAALDYDSTQNIRIYGRPGVMIERGGSRGNLRTGVAYSFLMGGHRYTNVTNQFQFAGDKFNLRGVDDGSGFVTANVGLSAFVGKRKLSMVSLDYAVMGGGHSTTHAGQLGFQRVF